MCRAGAGATGQVSLPMPRHTPSQALPAAHPYLDSHFCSHCTVAGFLHVTALPGVAVVCFIKVGVVEVCVVIQATAVNLRGTERKEWEEHPSGLLPCSDTIWTPLAHGGGHPAQPCLSGLLSITLGPGFCPTHHHTQLSSHQVPSRQFPGAWGIEEVVTAQHIQDCDVSPCPSHCPTQTCTT